MKILCAALLSFLAFSSSANADVAKPARDIWAISGDSKVTPAHKVKSARILIADYALIKKDFSFLEGLSNEEIDAWLLLNTAYISETQLQQTKVNTEIALGESTKTAFRPPDYNRALVFEVAGGMIDGKGFGSTNPAQGSHSNGLATSGEVIREFIYQKLVQRIFEFSHSERETVGSYAAIDWGFRVKHDDGTSSPAGAILRQAHRRNPGTESFLDHPNTIEVEKILRRYGITSAGAYRHWPSDALNIQGTSTGEVIDFGGFLAVEKFEKKGVSFRGSSVLLLPGTPNYIQPDPILRVPLNVWGTTVSNKEDPKADNIWIWSHELAEAFAEGRASKQDVENHLHNFLSPVEKNFELYRIKSCTMMHL